MSTTTVPLTSGAGPVPVQVDGNTPAGYSLINTDSAATITIKAGATGPQIAALQPGGMLVWRDAAVFPFAYATGGSGSVVLVVTDQASDYSNPAAVAAVTATKLAAQGIPNTMLDTDFGMFRLNSGGASATVTGVGQCTQLIIDCEWGQPTPQGQAYVQLVWDDPTSVNFTPITQTLTSNNQIEGGGGQWAVPVLAPRLKISQRDTASSPCNVSIVGNNRPAPARIPWLIGEPETMGVHTLYASCPTTAQVALGSGSGLGAGTGSRVTRFNGLCTVSVWATAGAGPGYLYHYFVNAQGGINQMAYHFAASQAGDQRSIVHPSSPSWWNWSPDGAVAGQTIVVQVAQNIP